MFSKKIPVARILVISSWAVPFITAAGICFGMFLKGDLLLASAVSLSLAASVILAALLRMSANMVQMVFEIQNILQYSYKEHTEILSSLSASMQSMRKENAGAVLREIKEGILSGNAGIEEGIGVLPEKIRLVLEEGAVAAMREMNTRLLSCNVETVETLNALGGRLEALQTEVHSLGEGPCKDNLKSCLEELQEIRNNCVQASFDAKAIKNDCAQVSCDTRDIAAFFSLMEKHLNMKKE